MLYVCIKYFVCYLISCCVWSCDRLQVKSMYMIKSWLKTRRKEKM